MRSLLVRHPETLLQQIVGWKEASVAPGVVRVGLAVLRTAHQPREQLPLDGTVQPLCACPMNQREGPPLAGVRKTLHRKRAVASWCCVSFWELLSPYASVQTLYVVQNLHLVVPGVQHRLHRRCCLLRDQCRLWRDLLVSQVLAQLGIEDGWPIPRARVAEARADCLPQDARRERGAVGRRLRASATIPEMARRGHEAVRYRNKE